ncbi:MAG TPA: GNAT family N-acetyltransferase [Candidatus Binatia bacterium]|nr:GNAT family N-acetyltransferase [Candidatus Binatia bacterium]
MTSSAEARRPDAAVRWGWKAFDALAPAELYAALRLRSEIFVVEQDCVFLDLDGRDPQCEHLLGQAGGELLAYLRLVPPGVRLAEVSIGRVVVAKSARGTGLGRAAMQEGIRRCEARYPGAPIKVSAQQHLERFYASLGFARIGEPYIEDGIAHLDMLRVPG